MRLVGLVVGLVMLMSTVAVASPAAEKLFRDGKQLMQEGKLSEACDAFRKSQELEPRSGTLLNLGDCEEKRGRIATAWEAFVQSRALANQRGEPRATEAGSRADALASKLPYLTLRTPDDRPPGLVVKRDGWDVPSAELDREVPVDPGRYDLEVTAPGRVAWKQNIAVVIGQKTVVTIPALAVDPNATPVTTSSTTSTGVATPATPATSTSTSITTTKLRGKHLIGVGAAIGLSSDADVIYGIRAPVQIATVGPGTLRLLPSAYYAQFTDSEDRDRVFDLYALGLGLEYAAPLTPAFFIAGGAGVGIDLFNDNYGNPGEEQAWAAARLSPTARFRGRVDVGMHLQLVKTSNNTVGLASLGVDYFFY